MAENSSGTDKRTQNTGSEGWEVNDLELLRKQLAGFKEALNRHPGSAVLRNRVDKLEGVITELEVQAPVDNLSERAEPIAVGSSVPDRVGGRRYVPYWSNKDN